MATWGNCDYKGLEKLQRNLEKLQRLDLDKFCIDASRELAARLLALVIPRTPVRRYPKSTGKKGGTLRRGWTAKTQAEAEGGGKSNAAEYASSLAIQKSGSRYTVTVTNPVSYASYVEFGHRTRGGKGWVNGQYFLTISEQELKNMAPAIIERKLSAVLREAFDD